MAEAEDDWSFTTQARQKYLQAGRIAAKARDHGASLVREGTSLLAVAEAVEALIVKEGGQPAFPCCLSVNDVAAHFTPGIGTTRVFNDGDVVKVDVGVHVDGYVADTARTVVVGDDPGGGGRRVAEAAHCALQAALPLVEVGRPIEDLAQAIHRTLFERGVRPVTNLMGHSILRWNLHAPPNIPSHAGLAEGNLAPGQVIAVEPFATTGSGEIIESGPGHIYKFVRRAGVRTSTGRAALDYISRHHRTFPFSERWLVGEVGRADEVKRAVADLCRAGALMHYGALRDPHGALVGQFEHTVLVTDEGGVVTTLPQPI